MRPARTALLLASLVVLCVSFIACGGGANSTSTPPATNPFFNGFASRVDVPGAGTTPEGLVLADFNGDGKLDIATSWFSNQIAVYPGHGDGTFGTPVVTNVAIPNTLGQIAIGDFNEDGRLDLVAATIAGPQSILVFFGKGDGTFQTPTAIPGSFGFLKAWAIDINGDKHLDLVTSNNGSNWIFLGKGDGTFTPGPTLPPNASNPGTFVGLVVGDFNNDKKIDFAVVDYGYGTGALDFYAGNGDGSFQPPVMISAISSGPADLFAADFNKDGNLDLLIGFKGEMEWMMLGDGKGSFHGAQSFSTHPPNLESWSFVTAADFNRDGAPDIVVQNWTGTIAVLLNDGAGNFPLNANHTLTGLAQARFIAAGDLNGDGIPDLVSVNSATNVASVFLATKR